MVHIYAYVDNEIEKVRLKNGTDMDPLMTQYGRTMKLYTNEMLHNVKKLYKQVKKPDKTKPSQRHHCD